MKFLYFLSIFIGAFHFSDATIWTLNPCVLEKRLPPGVSMEDLIHILENEGVDVRLQASSDLTLWKGRWSSISLSPSPFMPYHLWVAVEERQTLDECTTEELEELYLAIWKSRQVLAQMTGADSFMIFMTEQMRVGKGSSSLGVEIIPSGFGGSKGVMDAVEKNALNDYVFYNRFSLRNVVQSPKVLSGIREKLQTLEPTLQAEKPQGRWSQKLLHHKEALYQNLQSIHDILAEMGALVEGELPPSSQTEETVHEIQIDVDKCAFCNPKVIEKQIVCDWKDVQVLMSHKPFSPHGNFLILPKRHQCTWNLTKQEALASFEAVIALKKMFSQLVGKSPWICYIQDGLAVGQTVPHTHIHFYIVPDPLKSAITSIQHVHNQRRVLNYDEMRAECEKIKPLLLTYFDKD